VSDINILRCNGAWLILIKYLAIRWSWNVQCTTTHSESRLDRDNFINHRNIEVGIFTHLFADIAAGHYLLQFFGKSKYRLRYSMLTSWVPCRRATLCQELRRQVWEYSYPEDSIDLNQRFFSISMNRSYPVEIIDRGIFTIFRMLLRHSFPRNKWQTFLKKGRKKGNIYVIIYQ